jgi:hypothetical protein
MNRCCICIQLSDLWFSASSGEARRRWMVWERWLVGEGVGVTGDALATQLCSSVAVRTL